MAASSTVTVDAYVLDTLMPDLVGHDRQPTAFLVYLRLWRATGGGARASAEVSLRELSDQTGMSKRAIQDAVETLARRGLISIARERPTAVPAYRVLRPWKR
jgi:DNA-binding GntR family transcriptional regulator